MRTRNHGGPSRRAGSLMAKRNNAGYLFICPFLVGMLFIFLPSLVESFSYSLEFATVQFDSVAREYVGFQNYIAALTEDTEFLPKLYGAVQGTLVDLVVILFFSFLLLLDKASRAPLECLKFYFSGGLCVGSFSYMRMCMMMCDSGRASLRQ